MKLLVVLCFVVATLAITNGKLIRKLRQGEPCEEPGFYPDADDCKKFYRCAEHATPEGGRVLTKYEFKCAPGTVYDDSISSCNHLSNIENPPKDCMVEYPEEGPENPEGGDNSGSETGQGGDNTGSGTGEGGDNTGTGGSDGGKSIKPIFLTAGLSGWPYYIPISNNYIISG